MIATAGAAAPRVHGRLDLVFERRRGGTVLSHAYAAAPLKIVRPFTLGDGRALVQILALGPGLCAGDECTIGITVEPEARAVVIMQTASRILGMGAGTHATQSVTLVVRAGGQLEYYPGLTIPFADSRIVQRVQVEADRDARLGVLESWATGRIARGEHLRFRRISSRTTVRVDGAPVYADAIELEPAAGSVGGRGIMEGYRYVASGVWHGVTPEFGGIAPAAGSLVAFGACGPDRAFLRALATDGASLGDTIQEVVGRVNAAWQMAPIPLRRFTS